MDEILQLPISPAEPTSQPFSLPADITSEGARVRLSELKQDEGWLSRWAGGGPASRESAEFDALTQRALQADPTSSRSVPIPEMSQAGKESVAAAANARIAELKQDKAWIARYMKGGSDSAEGHELDRLERLAVGMPLQDEKRPPTENERALAALGAPAAPSDYNLDLRDQTTGFPLKLDEPTSALVNETLLPAAHALDLSQSDVALIAMGVQKPMDAEQCSNSLHRLWGKNYDARLDDFRAAMATNPKARELLTVYPDTLGNNAGLISSIVAAFQRRQGRK